MEFNGTFEIEGVSAEEVWLALSDPELLKQTMPGCDFLVEVEDPDDVDFDALAEQAAEREDPSILPEADPAVVAERTIAEGECYAGRGGIKIGSVNPTFDGIVTITRREFPEMHAEGEGGAPDSSFEGRTEMTLVETDDGVAVEWWAEAEVFGRVARMGQRVLNPVANQVVNRFFSDVADRIDELEEDPDELRELVET